jgi:hypothetical protein
MSKANFPIVETLAFEKRKKGDTTHDPPLPFDVWTI